MARKPTETKDLTPVTDIVEATPVDVAQEEIAEHQHFQIIDQQFGNDLPYDKGRIEDECKFYLRQSAMAMIQLGKRLILLKEHEPHGEFGHSLKRIGVEPRTATNMMKATLKFEGKTETFSVLKVGKLYELMTQDDDNLQELEDGGTLAGLNLDEIDRMTVRDLRKALRDRDEDLKAKDKVLSGKDEKINELDMKLNKKASSLSQEWDHQIKEDAQRVTDLVIQAKHLIAEIRALQDDIEDNSIYGEGKVQAQGMQVIGSLFWTQAHELTEDCAAMMQFADRAFQADKNRGGYDIAEILQGVKRDE